MIIHTHMPILHYTYINIHIYFVIFTYYYMYYYTILYIIVLN